MTRRKTLVLSKLHHTMLAKPDSKKESGIRHIWSILCQSSAIDRDSNSLSLFHLVEEITITKEKGTTAEKAEAQKNFRLPVQLELVSLWDREDAEERSVDAKMQLLDPQGKVLINQTYPLNFEKGKRRLRFRAKMGGLIVSISGEYLFVVSIREGGAKEYRDMAEVPLTVKITE